MILFYHKYLIKYNVNNIDFIRKYIVKNNKKTINIKYKIN